VTVAVHRGGRHRYTVVVPRPPDDEEKGSYAWRSLPFLTCALTISAVCTIVAQTWFEYRNPVALPFCIYTALYFVYQAVSLPVNFAGRSFALEDHQRAVAEWWPSRYPTVDVFLPICGEPVPVLANTWEGVAEMCAAYPGYCTINVLDDGPSDEAMELAASFNFTYVRRPNIKEFKKTGNLKYTFERTFGEHICIFDADFRPRSDFLLETLPYMDNPSIGIVQTPQFFRVEKQQTWVEKAAGATLEIFYRSVQVSRDRLGSALCVGSNAVYRRAGLEPEGGFTMIPYAEDSHTGLDMRRHGYQLKYLPVPLAAGVCPATIDLFMRQQYRWCCGATSLVCTKHMWRVPMAFKSRLPYIAGWLWNVTTAVRTLVLPLIPIVLLAFLPEQIQLRNSILLIPAVITGMILYPLWHNARWPVGVWPLTIAVGWAQALALWDFGRGKVMSWQPSRGPGDATRRFRKAVVGWNGTLAFAWLGLALWRIFETGSIRFTVVAIFGAINFIVLVRIIFPGRDISR
jgi:cellulose synthase (UDP-forming)